MNDAAEIKLRAERRLGELLREQAENGMRATGTKGIPKAEVSERLRSCEREGSGKRDRGEKTAQTLATKAKVSDTGGAA